LEIVRFRRRRDEGKRMDLTVIVIVVTVAPARGDRRSG
jgi:hypothetical protein